MAGSGLAPAYNREVSTTIEGDNVNLMTSLNESSKHPIIAKPPSQLSIMSSTYGGGSGKYPAARSPVGRPAWKGSTDGIVYPELLTFPQKVRWQMRRHKGGLNIVLCFLVMAALTALIITSFVFITVIFPPLHAPLDMQKCRSFKCSIELCESIPLAIPSKFQPRFLPIYQAWANLLEKAENYSKTPIVIASQYWSMLSEDIPGGPWPTANLGEDVFKRLKALSQAGSDVTVVDSGKFNESAGELAQLAKVGAKTYVLNVAEFLGNGILHTKSLLVGDDSFYVGSANMDWRALTEVKEMGLLVNSCPCLAADFARIHQVYVGLASGHLRFDKISRLRKLRALTNATNRLEIETDDGQQLAVYLSSSPPPFSGLYRTSDIDAVVDLITSARDSVCIEVMDYAPALVFQHPRLFWPKLDDAIRQAAYESHHNMSIRLLIGKWRHTPKEQYHYLKSLFEFYPFKIHVRLFEVPGWDSHDPKIPPFSRVNHAKYLVTETSAWIGTSNWSGDYFVSTAGIGVVVRSANASSETPPKLVRNLQSAFDRDWNSPYAVELEKKLNKI